jgi:hypothetical protein
VLLTPHSEARSNLLKRHEIVSRHALPLKIEILFSLALSRLTFATPATSCWRFLVPKWKRYHPPNGGRLATLPPTDLMTISHPTLNGLVLLGDSGGTQGNAQAAAPAAERRDEPEPARRPTKRDLVVPTAATVHAERALPWSNGIANRTLGVFVLPQVNLEF